MEFRIRQGGITVAAASGNAPEAEAEILHYARLYRQDGELTIQVKHTLKSGDSWKLHMKVAQFPQPSIKGIDQ